MSEERRRWGRFYTEPDVADLVIGFCLRRPDDRLLDPSCGQGAFLLRAACFQRFLSDSGGAGIEGRLCGVEIDPVAARTSRRLLAQDGASARILARDFFSLEPGRELALDFDCIVGNPPYTRSEWLGRIGDPPDYKERLFRLTQPLAKLSRRAGLHAHFLVHGSRFLRPQGRFGFVMSNSWLDVDYGIGLKHFLLAEFKIIAVLESAVERWFSQAKINTCIVILEKCPKLADRMRHHVRFVRLKRPLQQLLTSSPDEPDRVPKVRDLVARLQTGPPPVNKELAVRLVSQAELGADSKWGLHLRAPEVFFRTRTHPRLIRLGEIASVRRGQTTGANRFFYLSEARAIKWRFEKPYLWPLLKSPKDVECILVRAEGLAQRALIIPRRLDQLAGTNVLQYIDWGESKGYHQRKTCARRPAWYALSPDGATQARLVWPKGIWSRHLAPLLVGRAVIDQQFYLLVADPELVPLIAAILNSTWTALQAELLGRSNFGEGVLWLAAHEVARFQLPNVKDCGLSDRHALRDALRPLLETCRLPIPEQVTQPAQKRLDSVVFDMLRLDPAERDAVTTAAVERAVQRIQRAESVGGG